MTGPAPAAGPLAPVDSALYVLRVVPITAVQLTEHTDAEVVAWLGEHFLGRDGGRLLVNVWPGGVVKASYGDWLLLGGDGLFRVCQRDLFASYYELAPSTTGPAPAPVEP